MGGLSPTHLLIVLAIALVIFGTKRLKTIGSDLGSAVRGFKKAMNDDEDEPKQLSSPESKDAEFTENHAKSTNAPKT